MLKIVLYNQITELYQLSFIEEIQRELVIVAPDPVTADAFSERCQKEVTTISFFMKQELGKTQEEITVCSKRQLLFKISRYWREFFQEFPRETFFQAFDRFTELRSFTTNLELVEEVLGEFDPVVGAAIKLFWYRLDQEKITDEQALYSLLSQAYRQMEHPIHQVESNIVRGRSIIFWGFSHLSSGQIDLLNALSIRDDIYIPFSRQVYVQSNSNDWIRWLKTEVKETAGAARNRVACQIVTFARNRMAETLSKYAGKLQKHRQIDLFLMARRPSIDQITEIPLHNLGFKAGAEFFTDVHTEVMSSLGDNFWNDSKDEVARSSICAWIKEEKEKFGKNYRKLKILLLLEDILADWEEKIPLNHFDYAILGELSKLQLPRASYFSSTDAESRVLVRGIDGPLNFDSSRFTIICATSAYQGIKGAETRYSDKVIKFLQAIGPIHRQELDYLVLKEQLLFLFSSSQTLLVIEDKLWEHDLGWGEIFQELIPEFISDEVHKEKKERRDYLADVIVFPSQDMINVSPTRMQSFYDCPRGYYFKYIERPQEMPTLKKTLLPNELGTLEHQVISEYCGQYERWDDKAHRLLVVRLLKTMNKEIGGLDFQRIKNEIIHYSMPVIQLLLALKNRYGGNILFEVPVRWEQGRGSIDCLLTSSGGNMLFDFKRSEGSIPGIGDFLNKEELQIWYYLFHLPMEWREHLFLWGYLNLSDLSKSLLFSQETIEMAAHAISVRKIDGTLSIHLEQYAEIEKRIIDQMQKEARFPASPRNSQICNFCAVKNLCPRSELV